MVLFVGDDWAEAHHDIEVEDDQGGVLVRRRLPEGLAGMASLHELLAGHADLDAEPSQVIVGIETDKGPWVQALLAAGYRVFPINPIQAARYRERHTSSGAKSDPGDAHVLAEIVRVDRAAHRRLVGDSAVVEQVKITARAHQSMIWTRQRSVNTVRSMLRDYYPGFLATFDELATREALLVLAAAPAPEQGLKLTLGLVEAEAAHRDHAIIEAVIADLKDGPLAHAPSGKFTANSAWLALAAIAFNLTRAAARIASVTLGRARTATVRRALVNVAARIANQARHWRLHLPRDWPWQTQLEHLFDTVHGPPTPATL